MIEILHRYTKATLYASATANDIATAIIEAVKTGAHLRGADLDGADLDGAYLRGANLGDTTVMPNGETWKQYREEVLPALLTAGGKSLAEVACAEHWDCHDWGNCPMAAAFGIASDFEGPPLLRPRIREFIQLFDARLIPMPVVGEEQRS